MIPLNVGGRQRAYVSRSVQQRIVPRQREVIERAPMRRAYPHRDRRDDAIQRRARSRNFLMQK